MLSRTVRAIVYSPRWIRLLENLISFGVEDGEIVLDLQQVLVPQFVAGHVEGGPEHVAAAKGGFGQRLAILFPREGEVPDHERGARFHVAPVNLERRLERGL